MYGSQQLTRGATFQAVDNGGDRNCHLLGFARISKFFTESYNSLIFRPVLSPLSPSTSNFSVSLRQRKFFENGFASDLRIYISVAIGRELNLTEILTQT